jgi:hypothetical protein
MYNWTVPDRASLTGDLARDFDDPLSQRTRTPKRLLPPRCVRHSPILLLGRRGAEHGLEPERGTDLLHHHQLGVDAHGWDPAFRADEGLRPTHIVNLRYVVNVIEDVAEREPVRGSDLGTRQANPQTAAVGGWRFDGVFGVTFGLGVGQSFCG